MASRLLLKHVAGIAFLSVVAFLPVSASSAGATLEPYSIDASDVEQFASGCRPELTVDEMRAEIPGLLARLVPASDTIEKLTTSTEVIGRVFDFFKRDPDQNRFNVVLDGLPLLNFDRANFFAIADLTALDGAAGTRRHVSKVDFQSRPWVTAQRFCLSEDCRKRNRENGHDLRAFNFSPLCQDALCASQRLFGDEAGVRILWIYLKYGSRLGPFTNPFADAKGLSIETVRALEIAFRMLPEFHRPVALVGSNFYHFARGETLPLYRERRVFANEAGAIFDPIDKKTLFEQAALLFHEVAHRTTLVDPLDASAGWLHASGWRMDPNATTRFERGVWPSYYSRSSPLEDYAETFVKYRLRPEALFKVSPRRYEFMKQNVFRGYEFIRNRCGDT